MHRKYLHMTVIFSWLLISTVSAAQSVKKVSPASFSALEGGVVFSQNGCYINRPDDITADDGDMHAGFDLPVGSTITGITAHFLDWAQSWNERPLLMLRKHQGAGNPVILASAQSPVPISESAFYEQGADIDPNYEVVEGDFFDLIFVAGEQIVNAYYICGVEIQYITAE